MVPTPGGPITAEPAVEGLDAALTARFQVHRVLGSGDTSVVVSAHDTLTASDVALKVSKTPADGPLLAREFRLTSMLDHPNLAAARELIQTDTGTVAVVLAPLSGPSVRAANIDAARVPGLLVDLASALAEIHRAGLVHGDVKPDNILLEPDRAVLIDLGFAAFGGSALPPVGFTPNYVEPGYDWMAQPAPSADMYALGCVLAELLDGLDAAPESLGALATRLKGEKAGRPSAEGVLRELQSAATRDVGPQTRMPQSLPADVDLEAQDLSFVVALVGEDGSGRTTLARQALPDAVRIQCHPADRSSLRAVEPLAEQVCAALDEDDQLTLAEALPGLAERMGVDHSPSSDEAIATLLARAVVASGAQVVIDDLHHADPRSGDVLGRMMVASPDCIRLVVTSRPEGTPALRALRTRTNRSPVVVHEVAVPRIAPEASVAFLVEAGVEPQAAKRRAEAAEGLPRALEWSARRGDDALSDLETTHPDALAVAECLAIADGEIPVPTLLSACGAENGFDAVLKLRTSGLVDTSVSGGVPTCRLVHTVAAEALRTRMAPERSLSLHHQLADALPETQVLDRARHLLLARKAAKARDLLTAEIAQAEQAGRHWDTVGYLELLDAHGDLTPDETRRYADALRQVGLARRAATVLRELAGAAEVAEAVELERQASGLLLAAGYESEGLTAMDAVMKRAGVAVPKSFIRQFIKLSFAHRSAIHDLDFELSSEPPAPELTMKSQVLYDVVSGVAMFRPFLSAAAQVDHLELAVRTGDPMSLMRALNVHLIQTTGYEFNLEKRAHIEAALQRVHTHIDTPASAVLFHGAMGGSAWMEGRAADHLRHLRLAQEALPGAPELGIWVRDSVEIFHLAGCSAAGEFAELRDTSAALVADAEQRDDRYLLAQALVHGQCVVHLAEDAPDRALAALDDAVALFDGAKGTILALFADVWRVKCRLYAGDLDAAEAELGRLRRTWRWSPMMTLDSHRAIVAVLAGLVAGALQRASHPSAAKAVRKSLKELAKLPHPWCASHHQLLTAVSTGAPETLPDGMEGSAEAVVVGTEDWIAALQARGIRRPEAFRRILVP